MFLSAVLARSGEGDDRGGGQPTARSRRIRAHGGGCLFAFVCRLWMCGCETVYVLYVLKFFLCKFTHQLSTADVRDVHVKQASTSGNVGVINLLLKKGADVSVTDKDGVTTLMSAASHGHAQVGATHIPRHGSFVQQ